ncbi:MAG TPA: DUF5937 family protein [Thermoleophilaceae bacterium]
MSVFIGPPPAAPRAEVGDELDRVLATPLDQVAAEIARTYPRGVPLAGHPFIDDANRALHELVDQMQAFWEAALAPWWPRLSATLESEIASRARRLVAVGAEAAFTGLHPTVIWDGGTLCVHPTKKAPADVELAGRGLLLVPAAFTWPIVWPRTDSPWTRRSSIPPWESPTSGRRMGDATRDWNPWWAVDAPGSCSSWSARHPLWSSRNAWR